MDSPLNRAHHQERKAEKLISGKKYMEAVSCFEVASAYITEAIKTTTASQALISMQLQCEDHLRKKNLLMFKLEKMTKTKSEIGKQTKNTSNVTLDVKTNSLEDSCNDDSCNKGSHCGVEHRLKSSEGTILKQESDPVSGCSSGLDQTVFETTTRSVEDLQMQVLSLTQALEDSNRENNHLRNIVVRFKDILQEKFGFSQEEIETMLISHPNDQNSGFLTDSVGQNLTECKDDVKI